jgi:hypothetical protein
VLPVSTFGIIVAILVAFGGVSFVFFLIGRDTGETKQYNKLMQANERLLKENLDLKWENNRLNRAMGYYDDHVLRSILEEIDDGPGPWSGQG